MMACVPPARLLVVQVATPELLTLTVASVVLPSVKVTLPVLTVAVAGDTTATVAVNVTDAPTTAGLAVEASVVVVLAWTTVWLRLVLLPVTSVLALYVAVMV